MFSIGPYCHPSRVIVAPMAGVTDRPFRDLCRRFGTWWSISEMVTSDQRLWHTDKSRLRLAGMNEPGVRWVQLAGTEPAMIADAARASVDLGAQVIDINMGCPAKKVCRRAAGSALLQDEQLVARILDAVVSAVDVPVTLKTRLGWSRDVMNGVGIARIAEDAGIRLLTMHGRTRACRFQGEVDYGAIGEVKAAVTIPVIANGDIDTPQKAASVLALTGCDGVMIARGVQGRPWLPAQIDHFLATGELLAAPDRATRLAALEQHVAALHEYYGEGKGLRIARKHVGWSLALMDEPGLDEPGLDEPGLDEPGLDEPGLDEPGDTGRAFNAVDTAAGQLAMIRALAGHRLAA